MFETIMNNPARIVAAIAAILVALRSFGLQIDDAQITFILNVVETGLAVVGLFFVGEAVRANIKGPVTVKKEEAAKDEALEAAA
jgi:uncharacterized membrane protein